MKKFFTPGRIAVLVLFTDLVLAAFFGFNLGTQEYTLLTYLMGAIPLFSFLTILYHGRFTINEESVEKEDLIIAMQIYNKNTLEDPESFFGGVDETRECAEYQVDYLLGIIKSRKHQ